MKESWGKEKGKRGKQCYRSPVDISVVILADLFLLPEKPPDEMECLYNHLKAASLSPIGQSSRRDFRASFIRRCQNDKVNEKLHLLRILSSTLKARRQTAHFTTFITFVS